MGFQEAIQTVLSKYADFSGRARRSEYWYWTLAVFLAYVVAMILVAIAKPLGFILYFLLFVAVIVPNLAVAVRRLHDTNKSGWFLLLGLIPFVGGLILLVLFCLDSDPQPNQYGLPPKGSYGYGVPQPPPAPAP